MSHNVPRRLILQTSLAAGATALAPGVLANTPQFPKSTLKMVVSFAPGGATDAVARRLADRLSKQLGQPVVVENRPGASGMLGVEAAAKAAPDGHTMVMALSSTIYSTPHIYNKVPFDVERDLAMVYKVVNSVGLLVVNPSVPAKDFKELMAHLKANPGKLSFASYGQGSYPHQLCEYLNKAHKADMVHVPYKGEAPVLQALLSNEVQVAYGSVAVLKQHIEQGKVRPIGVVATKRLPVMPNLPTLQEQGYSDEALRMEGWFGIIVPKKVPATIQQQLAQAVGKVMVEPEIQEAIKAMSFEPVTDSSPEKFTAEYREWAPRWKKLAEISGAKIDA